jgi:hypothetical protein
MNPAECGMRNASAYFQVLYTAPSAFFYIGEKELLLIVALRDEIEVHKKISVVPGLESSRKQWLT